MTDRFYSNARPLYDGFTPKDPVRWDQMAFLIEDEPVEDVPATPDVRAAAAVEIAKRAVAKKAAKRR